MTYEQEHRREQCPVCGHSIRVAEGKFVDHTRRPWVTMLSAGVVWCPASGAPVTREEQ